MPSQLDCPERHAEPRYLCSELVSLTWEERGVRNQEIVNLEEVSRRAMAVNSEVPLQVGTRVTIRAGEVHFRGWIHDGARTEVGFVYGVELHPRTLWSETLFRPQHLFDPASLLQKDENGYTTKVAGA